MADMTHKHHNLIYDAIEEAAEKLLLSYAMKQMMNVTEPLLGSAASKLRIRSLFIQMVHELAKSFSTRLRYTNDKFEQGAWQNQVCHLAEELWKKHAI